jgi:hypothetical protein
MGGMPSNIMSSQKQAAAVEHNKTPLKGRIGYHSVKNQGEYIPSNFTNKNDES